MNFTEYFRAVNRTGGPGVPLSACQAEAIFPGKNPIMTRERALDSRYTVEAGWVVRELDVDRLREAALALVALHGVFRSRLVLDEGLPHQQIASEVDAAEFFIVLESAPELSLAVENARAYAASLTVDSISPVKIVVSPTESGEFCILFTAHHFFVDVEGLRLAVRDLWQFYANQRFTTEPPITYERLCADYAEIFSDAGDWQRYVEYWSQHDRTPSCPRIEARPEISDANKLRLIDLPDYGAKLSQVSTSQKVLPVAVVTSSLMRATLPWLKGQDQVTLLLTTARSRMDRIAAQVVQCSTTQVPITVDTFALKDANSILGCKATSKSLLQRLRYSVVPPACLGDASAGQTGGLVLNFMPHFTDPPELSQCFGEVAPVPRPSPYKTLASDRRHDKPGTETGMIVQVVPQGDSLSILVGRKTQDESALDRFAEEVRGAIVDGISALSQPSDTSILK